MLKATSSIVNVSQITGVLPVVNGGTGVTTSTGTGSTVLSAAPTLSGNVTLSTGNLVVASGQGIDFSLTPGTGTSELLDDYEEGVWTPTALAGLGGAFGAAGLYTKTGRAVYCSGTINVTDITGLIEIGGLPFTSSSRAATVTALLNGATAIQNNFVEGIATTFNISVSGTYSGGAITIHFACWYFI